MRKGGGKPKGGKYELTICAKLAIAFKPLGIQEDDCYRTKNSGATKKQPGDIQFSPHFAKMFPVLVECKHYKSIRYSLGKTLSGQPKSCMPRIWWQQVIREQKERKDKMGVLVFRQNNCPDLICLKIKHFEKLCLGLPKWEALSWSMFTHWKETSLVILKFSEFLKIVVDKKKSLRILKKRDKQNDVSKKRA